MKSLQTLLPILAFLVFITGWFNLFAFIGEASTHGGSAGPVVDGRYYLDYKGTYMRTTRGVWEQLHDHEIVTAVTFPLSLGAMAYLVYAFGIPLRRGLHPGLGIGDRIKAIRSSGAALAMVRCHINVAGADNPEEYLVAVYPAGLIIQLNPLAKAAIRTEEIRAIDSLTTSTVRSPALRIRHAGRDIDSPVALYMEPDSPFAQVLRTLRSV